MYWVQGFSTKQSLIARLGGEGVCCFCWKVIAWRYDTVYICFFELLQEDLHCLQLAVRYALCVWLLRFVLDFFSALCVPREYGMVQIADSKMNGSMLYHPAWSG